MRKNRTAMGIALIAVVAVIAVLLVIGFVARTGDKQTGENAHAPQQGETAMTPGDAADETLDAGALIGNTQRTWPDDSGRYDDRAHAKPGEYSPDMFFNRPVWTPINHDGDFPDRATLREGKCQGWNPLEGKTQQQYVNARYMVVNEQAGPTKAINGIPNGYSHSPQGAVVAALNVSTFGPDGGDEIGKEAYEQLWSTSDGAKKLRDTWGFGDEAMFATHRYTTIGAPSGYKIVNCTDSLVVVDVATSIKANTDDGEAYLVMRVPMKWVDGDWRPDFSGASDEQKSQGQIDSLDGFIEVEYQ